MNQDCGKWAGSSKAAAWLSGRSPNLQGGTNQRRRRSSVPNARLTGRERVQTAVKVLGVWHKFDPKNRSTYPQVEWLVQIKFINDLTTEGECEEFFPENKRLTVSLIKEWRYICEGECLSPIPRMFGDYAKCRRGDLAFLSYFWR